MSDPFVNVPRDNAPPAKPAPAEYVPPTLVAYGSVSKLTQNMVGSDTDAGQNNRMMCL